MNRMTRCAAAAAVMLTGASALSGMTPRPAGAAAATMTFGVPTIADAIHTYGEPDINLDRNDHIYVSGPTGTGTQRSSWSGSFDAQAYRIVNQNPTPGAPNPLVGINNPPGGGDTEIVFDNRPTQGQYYSDLYALLCFHVIATHDGGASNSQNVFPGGCAADQPTADRQWMAVFDPPAGVVSTSAYTGTRPLIYLTYNGGGALWTKSTDGVTYTTADGSNASVSNSHFGNDGYPAIDQVTGKVFEAAGGGAGTLKMNIGTPDAAGNLTFLDDQAGGAANLVTVATGLQGSPDAHFPVLTIDKNRNLYASWNISSNTFTNNQVFVAAAPANDTRQGHQCTNCWTNWTPAVQVSDGLISTGDAVNSFSWSASGGTVGIADVAWYGSNKQDDPNANNCGADLHSSGCEVWNLFMNQVKFATDANGIITGAPATSTPKPVKVSPHPMHYGDICGAGTGCIIQQGNRNLADFFMVRTDSQGAAEIVYDDTSNGLLQAGAPPSNQTADHAGAPVVTVIRQDSGTGVFGTPVPTSPSTPAPPRDHIDGTLNNALFSPTSGAIAGANVPGMDVVKSQLSLTGATLTVTMKVADLTSATTATAVGGQPEYVTRWVMATPSDPLHPYTIFYAGMTGGPTTPRFYYAGPAQSSDLCSVSACFPHVITYPESGAAAPGAPVAATGHGETGTTTCPTTPSASNPCTVTITVNTADIGSPNSSSLLEEVGAYSFAVSHPQAAQTMAQSQADSVPLMIDGVCCYNFAVTPATPVAETPWAPALLAVGLLTALTLGRRRLRRARS
jgi:hypothetical protein